MERNARAAAGLGLAALGMLFTILFHLGARGIIHRGLQASLEVVSLVGLLGAAYALGTLGPGRVRLVAMALALPAAAWAGFATYLFGSFALSILLQEPLNVVALLLGLAGAGAMLHGAWRWSQDERAAQEVGKVRLGLSLVALAYLLSMVNDLAIGLTSALHASALLIAGFGLAAASLEPLPGPGPAAPPSRAGHAEA